MTEITEIEPHMVRTVRKSGDLYVGQKNAGRIAYVYFVRNKDKGDDKE
jgi:hypothetical protein